MCVIAICSRRQLTDAEIKNCWVHSHHGAGVAWADGQSVHVIKGLMAQKDLERELARLSPPYIVHFRLASVGGIAPELTHPFPVLPQAPLDLEWTGNAPVLFHNGDWRSWQSHYLSLFPLVAEQLREQGLPLAFPSGAWSDTRALASLTAVLGTGILDLLRSDVGKVALLYPDGRVETWGGFLPERGATFSNLSYQASDPLKYSWSHWREKR